MRLLILFLGLSISGVAQVTYRTMPYSIKKVNTFYPRQAQPDKYDAKLTSLEAPHPGGESYKSFLMRQKLEVQKKYPWKTSENHQATRSAGDPFVVDTMTVTYNVLGDPRPTQGGNPSDNAIAASDNYLIASWNSAIYYYDLKADTPMINPTTGWTHIGFGQFAGNINIDDSFDPKILYDEKENRFILLFLSVNRSDRFNTSKTVMGFSSTENPMDPWHVYEISGNPLNNNTWSDYPQWALSKDELFFTINLLSGGDWVKDFQRTVIWQIDKYSGFNGDSALTTVLWDSIYHNGQALRYLHPTDYGYQPDGKEMYFVSNRSIPINPSDTISYSYDSLFVVKIDDDIKSGSAKLTINGAKASSRTHTPPLGRQPSAANRLWTNDSRILGAFINDGNLQCVGTTLDTSNGHVAVFHGIAENIDGNMSVQMNIISDDSTDLGFPNITFQGYDNTGQEAMIGVNHSGPYDYPGMTAIYYDGQGGYSNHVKVVEGFGNVTTPQADGAHRWGDYFGLQRDFTEYHSCWMFGYIGNNSAYPGLYIAKVQGPGNLAGTNKISTNSNQLITFPNPTTDYITVDLFLENAGQVEIDLFDISGKKVDRLISSYASKGKNQFTFNTFSLPKGTYVLTVSGKSGIISSNKIVVK